MIPVSKWALSPQQKASIEAVIKTGSNKGAARALGISVKTVDHHMLQVIDKSGCRDQYAAGYGARLLTVLAYDRATRTEGGAV